MLLYFRAFVGRDEIGTDRPGCSTRRSAAATSRRTPTAGPTCSSRTSSPTAAMIDFTDPAARALVGAAHPRGPRPRRRRLHAGLRRAGAARHALPRRLDRPHDAQPLPRALPPRDAPCDRRYLAAHPRRGSVYFFTRAGYSGTPGSVRLRERDLARATSRPTGRARRGWPRRRPTCSTAAIGGAYGFGTDIGGYFDVGRTRRRPRSCSCAGRSGRR